MSVAEQQSVQPHQGNPVVKPKNDKVDLWCKWKKKDGWALVSSEHDESDVITDIEVPEGNPACRITIRLKAGASKLEFHPTTPIWAQEGSCPKEQPKDGPIATPQIRVVSHTADELCLEDLNEGAPCKIGYAIVFSDKSFLDPEIKNGGRI